MNTFALTATSGLNCFAIRPRQMRVRLVSVVTMLLPEYSLVLPLSKKIAKGHLRRLGEVPLAVRVLLPVVTPAKCSSLRQETAKSLDKNTA